jgi:hypothetical protein
MGNGLADQRGGICHSPLILGCEGKRVNEPKIHGVLTFESHKLHGYRSKTNASMRRDFCHTAAI